MPRPDGIAATRWYPATGSGTRILIRTTYDIDQYVYAALAAPAASR